MHWSHLVKLDEGLKVRLQFLRCLAQRIGALR